MSMEKRYPRAIMGTACIPWTESFQFDEETFRQSVRALIERGMQHIYLFGTAGEGYAVTNEQYADIVKVFAEEMNEPHLFPMVGIISLSLPVMHERVRIARDLGIRSFQISLPSWGELSTSEMFRFFHDICDPYPDCKFMHYNLMRAKRLVAPEEYAVLAAEIPNLVGAKITNRDLGVLLKFMSIESPLQFYFTENGFGFASQFGECGFLISLTSSNLKEAQKFYEACLNKDIAAVNNYQLQTARMVNNLMAIVSGGKIDGAYDKMFAKLIDDKFPLRLLSPYETVSDELFYQYKQFLQNEMPQWVE